VDLENAEFIDSAGLGALVRMKVHGAKAGARITLLNPSPAIEDILSVSKLSTIFDVATGLETETLRATCATPENLVVEPHDTAATSAIHDPESRIDEERRLAEEAVRSSEYERAIDHYERLIELAPDDLDAHCALAGVLGKKPVWQNRALAQWERVYRASLRVGDIEHQKQAQQHIIALRTA
jgi:tetratricopeptide (TPR) repeat protein